MSMNERMTRGSNGAVPLIAGVILLALGIVCVVLYAVGAPDQTETGTALGALRGALIWLAAAGVGFGIVLVVIGFIKRRSKSRNEG